MRIVLAVLMCISGVAVAAPVRLPGLPESVNGGHPVELTVYRLPRQEEAYDINKQAVLAVADAFQQRYPNVRLRAFSAISPPLSGGSDEGSILLSMAGGVGPDIMVTNFRQSDTYISQSFLLPLDTYVDAWTSTPEGKRELDRIIPTPKIWDVIKRKGPDGQTHIWAIPPILYTDALFYRKDLMRNAGLDPNRPPRTWDELFAMSVQICDPKKHIWGTGLNNSWTLIPYLWSMDCEPLRQDAKTGAWYAAYDEPGAVTAAEFGWKLFNQPWGICPRDEDHFVFDLHSQQGTCRHGHRFSMNALEKQGRLFRGVNVQGDPYAPTERIAFTISYMGDLRMNLYGSDPNLVGISELPLSPAGKRGGEINSSMLAINGSLTDPGKIEAAWAYIRFTCSEEARRIQTRVMVEGGFAKYLNPALLRQFGYTAYLRDIPPEWEEAYRASLRDGYPEPYGKNAQLIFTEMDIPWEEIKLLERPDTATIAGILRRGAQRTNERLLGRVSPAEQRLRDGVSLAVVLCMLVLFLLLLRFTLRTYGAALSDQPTRTVLWRRALTALLIMAPALLGVFVFQYVPLARGSVIAFQDYHILGTKEFLGLQNFGAVLFAPEFWKALTTSLKYAGLVLGLGFFAPMLLALALHEIPRGSLFFRVIYFLPAVTSGVTIMLLWKLLYDPSPTGALNQVIATCYQVTNQLLGALHLGALTYSPQRFLTDPHLALLWVIIPGIWAAVGPGSIIYLAALKQIPEDYYEAADVDGAGVFAKFRVITLPFLKPLLIINFVGACVAAFKSFEAVWLMTNGGPVGSTNVLGLEIWRNAFMYLKYGYATAMGWLLASLLIGFTIFQLQYLSKVQFRLAKSE